jgi:prophage regulatory protein
MAAESSPKGRQPRGAARFGEQPLAGQPASGPYVLRLPEVMRLTGLCETTLRQLVAKGQFPPSFPLAQRAVGWLASDVTAWVEAKAAQRLMFTITKKGGNDVNG